MKSLLVISILIFSSLVYAMPPYDMCQHKNQCSTPQDKMYKEFQACNGFKTEVSAGRVYSGECYHSGRHYRNTDTHHAATYFDIVDNDPRFGGSFSFFFKENPYKELKNEEASEKYSSPINKKDHTLDISNDEYANIYWEGQLPDSRVEYWFKTCGEKVYVQGAWGYHHQFICELDANEKLPISTSGN